MRKISHSLLTLAIALALDAGVAVGQNGSAAITVIKTTQGGDDTFEFGGSGPNGIDFGNGFTVTTTSGTSDPENNTVSVLSIC